METKTGIVFWPVLPCCWVPERQPENSAISLDLCKTASVTLRSIYQMCISMRLNSKLTIWTKKSLQKNIYFIWLYRFRISADSFYYWESIYATPKREIRLNPHRIKTLKRRKNVALFAPLLCCPAFSVCLVLLHRCEWSCFPPQLQPPIKVLTPDALHTSMQ